MIPNESYPESGKLIKGLPQLFKHSEVIGVFLGNEICASFMHNAEQLDKIVFYENFAAIPDSTHQRKLVQLYKQWESEVPNLTVLLDDGINFDVTADYIHHDMHMLNREFFDLFRDKLQNKLMSNCGFGCNPGQTMEFARYIDKQLIFPVLLYRDIMFYTFNEEKKKEIFEIMHSFLLKSNLVFDVVFIVGPDDYETTVDVLRLQNVESYKDQLDESLS